MAITLTVGERQRKGGTFQSTEALTGSTATAAQAMSITTDATTISAVTATGLTRNRFSIAAGVEGQEKILVALGTGEVWLDFVGGSATNFLQVMRSSGQQAWARLHYINAGWKVGVAGPGVISEFTVTGVTTTGLQTLNAGVKQFVWGDATATAPATTNRWSLGAGSEGEERYFVPLAAATGLFALQLSAGTSSGDLVFTSSATGAVAAIKFMNGIWRLMVNNSFATIATATGTA